MNSENSSHPVIALVGPTAVGKSKLALRLAAEFGADILSADSRQVYRYMDIGTVKPTRAEQAQVRHYLLDLVPPDDTFTVQRYRVEGMRVLRRVSAAGRPALVVGGTGFYIRALLDGGGLAETPPDPELRAELRREADNEGGAVLHERLTTLDPNSADRIHQNNVARVIRALEIVQARGGPIPPRVTDSPIPALYLGLDMDRGALRALAAQRIVEQVESGFVEEVRRLLDMGYDPTLPALQGFGYRQIVEYLQAKLTLPEAIEAYTTATNGYIRRQMTWFRADARIRWLPSGPQAHDLAIRAVERFLATK
ncbi:MAG: tRNA (adenosine(37)-N6)-dimethylallyltransferase MiaA [Chloroflexota bacterium]